MIITRAPLRISFAGGGTDIPAFFRDFGPGVVVSTSINRYVYVTLNPKFDGMVSVRYRIHENAEAVRDLKHPLIREMLLAYGIEKGVEIVIASEVPARGSGLGASSALAVALSLALEIYTGKKIPMDYHEVNESFFIHHNFKKKLAAQASDIEIYRVGSPIGKQDHYASAVGGLNLIKFHQDDSVEITAYEPDDFSREIEEQSMLFYLNMEHEYQGGHFVQRILKDQVAEVKDKRRTHELQRDNALQLWEHMTYGVPERFIDHVNENWRLKRTVHSDISNSEIDRIVEKAYAAGATAAKVCGAGGGGFLYLVVPPSMQADVRSALEGLHELTFKFDQKGVQCIFKDTESYASHKA